MGWVGMVVDLEGEPVGAVDQLGPDAVDHPVVQLPAVHAAEQLGQPRSREPLAVDEGVVAAGLLGGRAPPARQLQGDLLPVVGNGQVDLDQAGAGERGRVQHRHRPPRRAAGHLRGDPLGQAGPELGGLGEPDGDVVGDGVGAATGDRVVPGGLDQPPPAEIEERGRPAAAVQRLQRLGVAGQQPLGPRAGRLEADPGRGHAHEDVGPGARSAARPASSAGRRRGCGRRRR